MENNELDNLQAQYNLNDLAGTVIQNNAILKVLLNEIAAISAKVLNEDEGRLLKRLEGDVNKEITSSLKKINSK